MSYWSKLLGSIFTSDRYILEWVFLTLGLFIAVLLSSKRARDEAELYNSDQNCEELEDNDKPLPISSLLICLV